MSAKQGSYKPRPVTLSDSAFFNEPNIPCTECGTPISKILVGRLGMETEFYCDDCRCCEDGCIAPRSPGHDRCAEHLSLNVAESEISPRAILGLVPSSGTEGPSQQRPAASPHQDAGATPPSPMWGMAPASDMVLPPMVFETLKRLERRTETFTTKVVPETKRQAEALRGTSKESAPLGCLFEIAAQVSLGLSLLHLALEDEEIMATIQQRLDGSRNQETLYKVVWMTVCEKWLGNA